MERIRRPDLKSRLRDRFGLEQPLTSAPMTLSDVVMPIVNVDPLLSNLGVFTEDNVVRLAASGTGPIDFVSAPVGYEYEIHSLKFNNTGGDGKLDDVLISKSGAGGVSVRVYSLTAVADWYTDEAFVGRPLIIRNPQTIIAKVDSISTDTTWEVSWYGRKLEYSG